MDEDIRKRATELLIRLDMDGMRKHIRELEAESMHENFWKDPESAAGKMQELATLQKELAETEDFSLLLELGEEEKLRAEITRLEFALYLSGPYDKGNAIIALHSGQGGTEAMDWTQMLYRMYTRYIERKGWKMEEMDYTAGDEAGIKSVTMEVTGRFAFGF